MSAVIGIFRKKWVIQLIGIIALCALIWFFGDLVAIAGVVLLESETARLVCMLIIVLLWGLNNLLTRSTANSKNQKFLTDLAEGPPDSTTVTHASDQEIGILRKDFDEAIAILKGSHAKGRRDRQFVYQLPWYIIIGPPGCGKSTLLRNSGLKFPLSDRLGNESVRGVGGTRNCDWWFTEDAVLLDTAGRYTTQDSHQVVDQAAWRGFLDLIKKNRPRRPINGVLVAMRVPDLMQQTAEERKLHARAIRLRIQELNDVLGVRFPVYMVFTMCDLVAGFTEFFEDLGQGGRAQVWGETFPHKDQAGEQDLVGLFFKNFDGLVERLRGRVLTRMEHERDIQRRSRIFRFPEQIALLKDVMRHFLDETFGRTRYRSDPILRGVYFTSGTQEGTPIDRLMRMLGNAFHLDRQNLPAFSGKGRGYFIKNLLRDVVFPEADIAGTDQRIEKRRRLIQQFSYFTALVIVLGVFGLWLGSYTKNQLAMNRLQASTGQYQVAASKQPDWESDLKSLLSRMNSAYSARSVFAGERPLLMSFGLYQGDKLGQASDKAYHRLLRNAFLPVIKKRFEDRLRRSRGANPDVLYQLLRVYLMLADPSRFEPEIVKPWVSIDWEKAYANEPKVIAEFDLHLENLLSLEPKSLKLDKRLVDDTRRVLIKIPIADQVYARIKSDSLSQRDLDFVAMKSMGRFADRVFASRGESLHQLKIPGLFTYQGFHKMFIVKSLELATEQVGQDWVLGSENRPSPAEVKRLQKDLQALYFKEYVRYWDSLLDKIVIKNFNGTSQAIDVLEYASDSDSPLKKLLIAVDRNTSLTRPPISAAAIVDTMPTGRASDRMKKVLDLARQDEEKVAFLERPGIEVDRHFRRLNEQIRGESPIVNGAISTIGELHRFMTEIESTAESAAALKTAMTRMSGDAGDIIGRIRVESSRAPDPLKRWLQSLSTGSWSLVVSEARKNLNEIWRNSVLTHYESELENRYPLFRDSSTEATLDDFTRFFSANGIIDQFFNKHLKPFVDTTSRVWRVKTLEQQSIGISPSALKHFQHAAMIRDVYFHNGSNSPSVEFSLKPLYLDADIAKFTLSVDGQSNVYRHGPAISRKFRWPGPDSNGRVRLVFESLNGKLVSQLEEGPWAWFRTLDKATTEATAATGHLRITFNVDGHKVGYKLRATSSTNPFRLAELEHFRCPRKL